MKKKILALLLAALMLVSLLPTFASAATASLNNFQKVQPYKDGTFIDVNQGDWFYQNVASAYELNLMVGKSANYFDTESNMTVAEAMAIASRLNSIYYTGKAEFTQGTPWYAVYADYCAEKGIANPADYDLLAPITRAQFAVLFQKALPAEALKKINTVDDDMIPDVKVTDAFGAAVYALYRAGILTGNDEKGTFSPYSNIKRMEVAAIATRMAQTALRQSIKLEKQKETKSSTGGRYTPPTFTVSFDMQDHGEQVAAISGVVYGTKITAPTAPTETGYTFGGWYKEAECINAWVFDTDTVTADTTLYAKWTLNIYTVTYIGDYTGTDTVEHGGSVVLPQCQDEGYHFTFEADGQPWDGQDITSDVTVTVTKVVNRYTVTFATVTGGAVYDAATSGQKVTSISVDSGTAVTVTENKITIGGTDYYAIGDSGYAFKEFSGTVPATITEATTITPVFEEIPATFKAVYDTTDGANTLTFYYDNLPHTGENITVYENGTANYLFDDNKTEAEKWGYNFYKRSVKAVAIDSSVANYHGLTSTAYMFYGMRSAASISGAEYLDVSGVTNMSNMFCEFGYSATGLTAVPNVSGWNTANVTDMSYMFNSYGLGSTALTNVPNVSNWNTANVTSISNLFHNYANKATGLTAVPDVSKWNTGKMTDMASVFYGYGYSAEGLTAVPNVSSWNTASAKDMSRIFFNYGYKSTVLNAVPNVSNWNTGNVTDMTSMFYCYGDTSAVLNTVPDVSKWNTAKVTTMKTLFQSYGETSTVLTAVPDVANWKTSNVTDMHGLFYKYGFHSTALVKVPNINAWDTAEVTDVGYMLCSYGYDSKVLNVTLDLSGWKVAKMKVTDSMFTNPGKNAAVWSVTIPAKTGSTANTKQKWFIGDGTDTSKCIWAPADLEGFTLAKEPLPAGALCFTSESYYIDVTLKKQGSPDPVSLKYSTDGTTWQNYSIDTPIDLDEPGDKVFFKAGEKNETFSQSDSAYYYFYLNGPFAASGSVMSLVDPDCAATEIPNDYCFYQLFDGCENLTAAPVLPATTLKEHCYEGMFDGCKKLTAAPALPATTLKEHCYENMFYGCAKLTAAPALPATKLADYCYYNMFTSCASLTAAPALPATELADYCYCFMFGNCVKLENAPALPATKLAPYCYAYMFSGCVELETAPALPATELADSCYWCMFYGCAKLETAPALPAMTLAPSCYREMFKGCTSLIAAPLLPAETLVDSCYYSMFYKCSALASVTMLATAGLDAESCLWDIVRDTAESGIFYKAAAADATVIRNSISENFGLWGWTIQDYTPAE